MIWEDLVFPFIKWMRQELEHHFPTCVLGNPLSQGVNWCAMEKWFHGEKHFGKHGVKASELVLLSAGLFRAFTMQIGAETLQVGEVVCGSSSGVSFGRHWAGRSPSLF